MPSYFNRWHRKEIPPQFNGGEINSQGFHIFSNSWFDHWLVACARERTFFLV